MFVCELHKKLMSPFVYWVRVRVLQPRVSISFVHPLSFFVCSLYVIFYFSTNWACILLPDKILYY